MSKKIVISAIGGPEVLKYIDYDLPSNLQKDHVRIRQTSIGVILLIHTIVAEFIHFPQNLLFAQD